MPHQRYRYAHELIKKALKYSPIIGIIGHRQVGKTTLANLFSNEFVSLDQKKQLLIAEDDPDGFIENRKIPFTIDECQFCPDLFPALKEQVRKHPRPGQYLLTGSVRFTSKKIIKESLTGRIVNIEVRPLTLSETYIEPLPDNLIKILKHKNKTNLDIFSQKDISIQSKRFIYSLETGGLPGICFFRNDQIRATKFDAHIETILDRDLRLLYKTTLPFRSLRFLLTLLAMRQGAPFDLMSTARQSRISAPTLRKLLVAFEALFLIRTYPSEGEKRPVIFMEDQGLASHLCSEPYSEATNLLRGLHANLIPQFTYRPELRASFFQYRTRGGSHVPLAIKSSLGVLGIIPTVSNQASLSEIKSANSFCKKFPEATVLILHHGNKLEQISSELFQMNYTTVL